MADARNQLIANMNSIGIPDANTVAERVRAFEYDTMYVTAIGGGSDFAYVRSQKLFGQEYKHSLLRSSPMPPAYGRVFRIEAARIIHNFTFDAATENQIIAFEQFSKILIKIENKDYAPLSVSELLPYYRLDPDTVLFKREQWCKLIEPIDVPMAGVIDFTFEPGGNDLKTAAISTAGMKFGAGIIDQSNSPVMFLRLEFLGQQVRPQK